MRRGSGEFVAVAVSTHLGQLRGVQIDIQDWQIVGSHLKTL